MSREGKRNYGELVHERQSKQHEIAERRLSVAEMMRQGKTYQEMMDVLHCSMGTIAGDVSAILAQWHEQQQNTVETYVQQQLVRLDMATHALMPRVLAGEEKAINTLISLETRRSKLLGLDQVDLVIPWDHLTREQEERIAAGEDPRRVVYGKG